MARNHTTPWPTQRGSVLFAGAASPATISRALKAGRIRKLAKGLFSADHATDAVDLVATNRWQILSHFIPDAIIADRSAAQSGQPTKGHLFVISNERVRDLELPGLTICPRPGPAALDDDLPWAGGLAITSDARTLVDNLAISRGRNDRPARTLSRAETEDWLVRRDQLRPEGWLTTLRQRALEIADEVGVPERKDLIEELAGEVAGTRQVRKGAGALLASRSAGREWDPARIQRLRELAMFLANPPANIPPAIPADRDDLDGAMPFFEAYFSNFIEGTEFTIEEAEHIITSREVPNARPGDAHDILGTYEVVSDPTGRADTPDSPERLLELLVERHRNIMSGRPEKRPGRFKETTNQAGSYVFVEPGLVEGTLIEGFKLGQGLAPGFPRAAYQLFLISEVHPFDDGNGRVARAAMCAELTYAGQSRLIIPIVYRNEYLTGLRALSREGLCDVFAGILTHAWRWTAGMPWNDWAATKGLLETTNALMDPTDAERSGIRLALA